MTWWYGFLRVIRAGYLGTNVRCWDRLCEVTLTRQWDEVGTSATCLLATGLVLGTHHQLGCLNCTCTQMGSGTDTHTHVHTRSHVCPHKHTNAHTPRCGTLETDVVSLRRRRGGNEGRFQTDCRGEEGKVCQECNLSVCLPQYRTSLGGELYWEDTAVFCTFRGFYCVCWSGKYSVELPYFPLLVTLCSRIECTSSESSYECTLMLACKPCVRDAILIHSLFSLSLQTKCRRRSSNPCNDSRGVVCRMTSTAGLNW